METAACRRGREPANKYVSNRVQTAKLTEQRRHAEAAVLLDQYAKVSLLSSEPPCCEQAVANGCAPDQQDCEEAILALITGACWEEALRLVSPTAGVSSETVSFSEADASLVWLRFTATADTTSPKPT